MRFYKDWGKRLSALTDAVGLDWDQCVRERERERDRCVCWKTCVSGWLRGGRVEWSLHVSPPRWQLLLPLLSAQNITVWYSWYNGFTHEQWEALADLGAEAGRDTPLLFPSLSSFTPPYSFPNLLSPASSLSSCSILPSPPFPFLPFPKPPLPYFSP